jgi:hypothetical protein
MRLEKRRAVYDSIIGVGVFVAGVLFTWFTTSVEQISELASWRAAVWTFLEANGVVLEPGAKASPLLTSAATELPQLRIGWVLPFLLVSLGAVLTASGVSGTSRLQYMLENGSTVLYGYVGVGLIALLESGARPAIAGFTAIILFFAVATFVGSTALEKLTGGLPFFGVASLGLVIIVGMILVLVGVAILTAILPMIIVSVSGAATGAVLLWSVRNAPR